MRRRTFLQLTGAGTVAAFLDLRQSAAGMWRSQGSWFRLHPFVEAHPEAVFIMKTAVTDKRNALEKLQAGHSFASRMFSLSDSGGIPVSHAIALKPNLTCTGGTGGSADGMGIRTDMPFLEGVLEGMRGVGLSMDNVFMREGNWLGDGYCPGERLVGDAEGVAGRSGVHLLDLPSGRKLHEVTFDTLAPEDVTWRDIPDGVVFRRIGFLHPFNHDESWILNISKFKTHSMGMTLCVKNLQGTVISPLVRFCEGLDATAKHASTVRSHFQGDLESRVQTRFASHLAAKLPRWDRPGRDAQGGFGMETWAQRTCDSHSAMGAGLHVIEGLYGRNGDGFNAGPGSGDMAEDFLTNMIIFGTDAFRVDVIGHWLGGHEPGNFGLFHIARERGLLSVLDPSRVPIYVWEGDDMRLTPLSELERTPLVCPYLTRDYNGGVEPRYHLVNEPFDYGPSSTDVPSEPGSTVLGQNYENPVRGSTIIEYRMRNAGRATIELFDSGGRRIDVITDGWRNVGTHMARWNSCQTPAGRYFYRFSTNGFSETKQLVVLR
ncbi:MAG: DUF362 domain-containing protein [Ignavibacteriae bacterium]|nr:DUF362 domain-containing protein [Ignavibacteriota bacterium]